MQYLTDMARGLGVVTKFIIETGYLNRMKKFGSARSRIGYVRTS